jgi:hypothetical protein
MLVMSKIIDSGQISSNNIVAAEERFREHLIGVSVGMCDAIATLIEIRDSGQWQDHTVPDPKRPGERTPVYRRFFDDYVQDHLLPMLADDPRTKGLRSLGSWKNTLRACDQFIPLGYTITEIYSLNRGIIARLEQAVEFERGTRAILGLSGAVRHVHLIPPPMGVHSPTSTELAESLINAAFSLDQGEAARLLDEVLGERKVLFVESDDGSVYAAVYYPAPQDPAVQRYPLEEFGDWPEWLRAEWRRRLGLKDEQKLLSSPKYGEIIAKAMNEHGVESDIPDINAEIW